MLEQNIADGKQGNSNHTISDEELDAIEGMSRKRRAKRLMMWLDIKESTSAWLMNWLLLIIHS